MGRAIPQAQHILSFLRSLMTRRASSSSPPTSPKPAKRQRIEHLTSESFKNGVMLAPMVRSGALPTRLYALKHGAKLVWSPEVVDKAILRTERVVDPTSGVVSYNGITKAVFTTHPVEKPYLIYQIGSADPELAVQAAKIVMQDVSGIDLNCGCPKPFSTHAGMGAALLSTPDLLCSILTALRAAMPPEITVSAKIRLLPNQEDTLKLVERIVNTGITNLTVHCRTRNMRPREAALIDRMREIVDFVEGMGKGVSVIQNGDCTSRDDAIRKREITHAHSYMIATAAESNPTCFSAEPMTDLLKTFTPDYIRLCRYLDNHFSSTKFCVLSFKGGSKTLKKTERQDLQTRVHKAKNYDDLNDFVDNRWDGAEEMKKIVETIESRVLGVQQVDLPPFETETLATGSACVRADQAPATTPIDDAEQGALVTPQISNPIPTPGAPLLPANDRRLASLLSLQDIPTPSPTPRPRPVGLRQ